MPLITIKIDTPNCIEKPLKTINQTVVLAITYQLTEIIEPIEKLYIGINISTIKITINNQLGKAIGGAALKSFCERI